jgi:hypothetical protein
MSILSNNYNNNNKDDNNNRDNSGGGIADQMTKKGVVGWDKWIANQSNNQLA